MIPSLDTNPDRGSFKSWLLKITHRRIIDTLRKRPPASIQPAPKADRDSTSSPINKVAAGAGFGLESYWEEEWRQNLLRAALEKVKSEASPRRFQIFYLLTVKGLTTPEVAKALRVSSPQVYLAKHRVGLLVKRAVADRNFDELHRVNHIRGQTGRNSSYISSPAGRKSAICKVLAKWPPGGWLEYSEALRSVNAFAGDWDVMEESGVLFLSDAQYGAIHDCDEINSQYLRALLMESLATLGLVDIAYVYPHGAWPELSDNWGAQDLVFLGRYDGLMYVRLNPLGSFCVGVNPRYSLRVEESPRIPEGH